MQSSHEPFTLLSSSSLRRPHSSHPFHSSSSSLIEPRISHLSHRSAFIPLHPLSSSPLSLALAQSQKPAGFPTHSPPSSLRTKNEISTTHLIPPKFHPHIIHLLYILPARKTQEVKIRISGSVSKIAVMPWINGTFAQGERSRSEYVDFALFF